MSFLAPGWIGLALLASAAVVGIHLIAWRLPRTVALPTARFVPDEPARRAARNIRPADFGLLALRVAMLLLAGLALARPRFDRTPNGAATVVAIERLGARVDTATLRGLAQSGDARFVVFDTIARPLSEESHALREATQPGAQPSLTVGLLAALREAHGLESEYDSVRIVLASAFTRAAFDNATQAVRRLWPDSIRLVRLPNATTLMTTRVDIREGVDDPVVAGIRLAEANGLIRGESRVTREAVAEAAPGAGKTLVIWPRMPDGRQRTGGIHAGDATTIGYFIPTPLGDSGRMIARWVNGEPAAREIAGAEGCVRYIGFDVPNLGDFVLTPSFQHLAAELLAPCGRVNQEPAPDSVLQALTAPPRDGTAAVIEKARNGNKIAALLMIAAVLLGALELWLRRRSSPVLREHAA